MNFMKKESRKELRDKLNIQMENNKQLREIIRSEQNENKAFRIENSLLKEKIEKLKKNVRLLNKDNRELANMLEVVCVKYNVKFDDDTKPNVTKKTRKKKEVKDSE